MTRRRLSAFARFISYSETAEYDNETVVSILFLYVNNVKILLQVYINSSFLKIT